VALGTASPSPPAAKAPPDAAAPHAASGGLAWPHLATPPPSARSAGWPEGSGRG